MLGLSLVSSTMLLVSIGSLAGVHSKSLSPVMNVRFSLGGSYDSGTDLSSKLTPEACKAKCDSDAKCISASYYVNKTGSADTASCSCYSGAPSSLILSPRLPPGGKCTEFCEPCVFVDKDVRPFVELTTISFLSSNPLYVIKKDDGARSLTKEDCTSLCKAFPHCKVATFLLSDPVKDDKNGTCSLLGSDAKQIAYQRVIPNDLWTYVEKSFFDSFKQNDTTTTGGPNPSTTTAPSSTSTVVSTTATSTSVTTTTVPTGTTTTASPTATTIPPIISGANPMTSFASTAAFTLFASIATFALM